MLIHVRDLEVKPKPFEVELGPGVVDYEDVKLRQPEQLRAKGEAKLVTGSLGEIRVAGHLAVEIEADCDRCLEPARFPVDADFELYYRPMEDGFGDEKEIDTGEAEMGFYEGDSIELYDVLREFVLLTLPMQRVCSEDCRGICPECGQNRNVKECQCRTDKTDDRWKALKALQS